MTTFVHPAEGRKITSPFGWRRHPISGGRRHHNGTDFGGTFKVRVLADGVVVKKGSNMDPWRGFGHSLTVDHGYGVTSLYAHGRSASKFNVGDRVNAGDVVYTSGSTGAATGPHLHLEVRVNGKLVDPVRFIADPSVFVNIVDGVVRLPKVAVDGRPSRAMWRRVQTFLKDYGYDMAIDGVAGRGTFRALQRWANSLDNDVCLPQVTVNGRKSRALWRRVQTFLKDYGYDMAIDGVAGRGTFRALQRWVNSLDV